MAVTPGDNGRVHGRAYKTRAFAAGASALTFVVTVGALAIHDHNNKAGATTNVDTGATTPTTQLTPVSPFGDDGNTSSEVNPFTGSATPGRSRGGGFSQPDTSSRGS